MITITDCFYLVSFCKWDFEMWSHKADDNINQWYHWAAFTVFTLYKLIHFIQWTIFNPCGMQVSSHLREREDLNIFKTGGKWRSWKTQNRCDVIYERPDLVKSVSKGLVTLVILTPNITIKRYYDNLIIFRHRFLLAKVSSWCKRLPWLARKNPQLKCIKIR
jgi:hypothetical protein